jgi:hypothetical protein
MKKLITLLLTLMLIFSNAIFANTQDHIKVNVNNTALVFDVNPTIIQGRTVLPVRAIFEALGLEVGWDGTSRVVTGFNNDVVIRLQIDQVKATVNGKEVILDVPATVVNGRTLVPARFVAEATGAVVGWNSVSRTVSIDKEIVKEVSIFDGYTHLDVDGGDISGYRKPSVVVDIGFGDREYWAFTNEYGQLIKVIADEIILQDDSTEAVLSTGRYYSDEAKVPGVESPTLDEGHVIADSLGGVANAYNITPQDSTLNRHGDQAYMEQVIRDAGTCSNFVAIITYPNHQTQTPSHYSFTYTINGNVINDEFDNVNPDEVNASINENITNYDTKAVSIISVGLNSEEVIIKNSSLESMQLKGYRLISTIGNQVYTFPDYILKAGEAVTVYSGKGSGDLKWTGSYIWNNDGDPAELFDANGVLISTY